MPRTSLRALGAALFSLLFAAAAQAADLTIGLSTPVTSLDPHFHNLTPNNSLNRHIFETLIKQDEAQRMQLGLAESWKALNDLEWEIKLRKGVKFHNGKEMGSADVKASMERWMRVNDGGKQVAAVNYRGRVGESKITGTMKGTLRTGFNMIALILRHRVAS